jgi:putative hemolysin
MKKKFTKLKRKWLKGRLIRRLGISLTLLFIFCNVTFSQRLKYEITYQKWYAGFNLGQNEFFPDFSYSKYWLNNNGTWDEGTSYSSIKRGEIGSVFQIKVGAKTCRYLDNSTYTHTLVDGEEDIVQTPSCSYKTDYTGLIKVQLITNSNEIVGQAEIHNGETAIISVINDGLIKLKQATSIQVVYSLETPYLPANFTLNNYDVCWPQIIKLDNGDTAYADIEDCYKQAQGLKTDNTRSLSFNLTGSSNTTISGATTQGGSGTSNHSLTIGQNGSGTVDLSECNLTGISFSLSDADFTCQSISKIELQSSAGVVKKTITSDASTSGTNLINLSLANVTSIADNDKLYIVLHDNCNNADLVYNVVLRTESIEKRNYFNSELFPSNTKIPLSISQKSGTSWCENSSAYYFELTGANGYTDFAFNNATKDGASYSVNKDQASITGTAQYKKCQTSVTLPIPKTNQPKAPVIAEAQYCNGQTLNYPINNGSDFSTETFRLLLDGTEKVGWQGTKTFNAISLGKVGEASAIVEATNGQCTTASSSAKIYSRISPAEPTIGGNLSYYAEQGSTTITHTNAQDGVTYKLYKDGSATPSDSWIIGGSAKTLSLTKGSYRLTAENANASCTAETNFTITENALNIGTGWTAADLAFCQLEGVKNLNDFVSFNSPSSVTFTSTSGLSLSGSNVDLATSTAGTYTITCTAIKDGVTKTFTKALTVKPKANDIVATLVNSTDFSCNTENPNLQVTTDYPGYTYTWYKGSNAVDGTARTNTIPLTKAEGSQNFTVVATATNGCKSSPSPALTLGKNYLTTVVSFTTGTQTICQSTGGTAAVFDYLQGSDKVAVSEEQSGYTYTLTASSTDMVIVNRNKIDLERTKPGTYTVTMTYSQNGCLKTITKQFLIKQKPDAVTIVLQNSETIECDQANPNASLRASHNAYTYDWYKKGTKVDGISDQTVSIPVSKADGLTTFYAIPILDGCAGTKSNEVGLTKKFVEANILFSSGTAEYCQKTNGTVDLFSELSGTDKIAVINSQSGYTYTITPSGSGLKMSGSVINLQTSQAGTYTVTMVIFKDGCSKTITKDIMIRQRPADFTIALTNAADFSCNSNAASISASVSGYTYKWYKNGGDAGTGKDVSIPVAKTDVTDATRTVYAIGTAENGCETNPSSSVILPVKTYLEADIAISSGSVTYCQSPDSKTADIFDYLSGADKVAVTTKQHYDWTISATGLTLASSGHEIDLAKSNVGTYTVSFYYRNEAGCSKTLTKDIVIKQKPASVNIVLQNAETIECDQANSAALVKAENSAYTYDWYKKGTKLDGMSAQSASIPVSKADGLTAIYAIPVLDGCAGSKTNEVSLTKKFVEANLALTEGVGEFCQTVGQNLDVRTLLSGADKDKIVNEQDSYTWDMKYSASGLLFSDSKSSVINLEKSFAQTYTSSLNIHRDGCSKTITKDIKIKPRPIDVEISLLNGDNIQCSSTAPSFKASVSKYEYKWLANEKELSEKTSGLTLPVLKTDGLVSVYAIPVLDGCAGIKSNVITTQKSFIDADLSFTDAEIAYCQKDKGTVDLFAAHLSGKDKDAVKAKTSGFDWKIVDPAALVINNGVIDLQKSAAGSYDLTFVIMKDGCEKGITKNVTIKAQPGNVTLSLSNLTDYTCNADPAVVEASVKNNTYEWYKNGVKLSETAAKNTIPVTKADGLTKIWAVGTAENGCASRTSDTITVQKHFVEVNLAYTEGKASYCQKTGGTLDMFTELAGTDKLAVQQKQTGWGWSFLPSTADLVMNGSLIDLEKSKAGTYTVSCIVTKDGCSKTLNKEVVVNSMPSAVTIALQNAETIECDQANPNALIKAENSAYTYEWYKKGIKVEGMSAQSASIPVTKADGLTTIYAIPFMSTCAGNKTNEVGLTKKFVEADLSFTDMEIAYCQKDKGTVDLFAAHLSGKDKDAVKAKTSGFDWKIVAPAALVINNGVIDLQKSAAGSYDLTFVIMKDGCEKGLTKNVTIKAQPGNVTLSLSNLTDYTCNADPAVVEASVKNNSYEWYKNGVKFSETTAKTSIPVTKADGLTKIWAVGTAENGCASRTSDTITVQKHFVEVNLTFSEGKASYCQKTGGTLDMFTELSGTDKLAVQQKQTGWGWSFLPSTADLVINGSLIDLEKSKAGTYTVSCICTKDGCSKTLNKEVVIKAMPSALTIEQSADVTCNKNNVQLRAVTNAAYTYEWYKKGVKVEGITTQNASIPVSKADGATSIYTLPYLDGCAGTKSNEISITKKFVEADFGYNDNTISVPGKDETVNVFDYTAGTDKETIVNQASGYSYKFAFNPVKQTKIASSDGKIVPSTGLQSGDTQYALNITVCKDGCDTIYTKQAVIKSIPRDVTIAFAKSQNVQECTNSTSIDVIASDTTSIYKWYKNDMLVNNVSSYKASIEVFKSDGKVKIYAIPSTKEGYAGYKTNELYTTKRYVTVDALLDTKTETVCSAAGKKINIFDYVKGADKDAIINGQFGYTYKTTGDCGLSIDSNKFVDLDNSLADDNALYNVALTIEQNGCSATQTKNFTIKRRPSDITIELLTNATNTAEKNLFCGGDSLSLHVSSSNLSGAKYNWYKDNALIKTTNDPTLVYAFNDASGAINLYATSSYDNGCPSSQSNVIKVQKKDVNFAINMASDPVAFCPETKKINLFDYVSGADKDAVMSQNNNCSYEFKASGNNGLAILNYSYLDLDNSTSAISPYTLTFNVSKNGCKKAFTKEVTIKSRPVTPAIVLSSNSENRYCGGDAIIVKDNNYTSGTSYKWLVNGAEQSGSEVLKYQTATTSGDLKLQAMATLNSNGCSSKISNELTVANVRPSVDLHFLKDTVNINEQIQLYMFETVKAKSIQLTATRADGETFDLTQTQQGNILTLKGMLPVGTYTFSAVAENVLDGYCESNIAVPGKIVIEQKAYTSNSSVPTRSEEERKKIYDEYMSMLKAGQVRSILLPLATYASEASSLIVYAVDENETVDIKVMTSTGTLVSQRTEFLQKGENTFTISSTDKPRIPGMYLIKIDYSVANRKETIKGFIK